MNIMKYTAIACLTLVLAFGFGGSAEARNGKILCKKAPQYCQHIPPQPGPVPK